MGALGVTVTSSVLGASLVGSVLGKTTIGIHLGEVECTVKAARKVGNINVEGEFLAQQVE